MVPKKLHHDLVDLGVSSLLDENAAEEKIME
jgi:hypothetical protein